MATQHEKDSAPALPTTTGGRVLETQIISPVSPSEMSDAELVAAAVKAHEAAVSSHDNMVEAAVRAGDLLREAQRRCKARAHSWSSWLLRHWQKSKTTAERYMALSQAAEAATPQVEQSPTARALQVNTALAPARLLAGHPSLRGALEEIGINAGGTRAKAEPEGLREPGADEDEERDNTPTGDMKAPTPAEAKVIDQIAEGEAKAKQAAEDAARARKNKHRDGRDSRPPAAPPTEAERAAEAERRRLVAEKVAAERKALEEAFKKPNGMEFPVPPADPDAPLPDALVSVEAKAKALAEALHDIARRIGLVSAGLGAIRHAPIEGLDFLTTGKAEPRRADLDQIIAGLRCLPDAVDAIEKWAPRLSAHGDLDARLVLAEQQRLREQEQDDRAAVDLFNKKRGA